MRPVAIFSLKTPYLWRFYHGSVLRSNISSDNSDVLRSWTSYLTLVNLNVFMSNMGIDKRVNVQCIECLHYPKIHLLNPQSPM